MEPPRSSFWSYFHIFTTHVHNAMGGYVFIGVCLLTSWGGYTIPISSHNTSTSSMSFWGRGYPSEWSQVRMGEYPGVTPTPSWDGVPPGQVRMGGTSRWGTPVLGWGTVPPPPPQDRLCLDRLCFGRYASCGFPQEDFLVCDTRLTFKPCCMLTTVIFFTCFKILISL